MNSSISNSDRSYRYKFFIFGTTLFFLVTIAGILNCYCIAEIEKEIVMKKRCDSQFWHEKIKQDHSYAVLFLGDSRTYRNVNPEIISRILSLKCYNFGFSSGGLNREIFRLAESKLNLSAPKIVFVLGITPLTLSTESRENKHYKSLASQKNADFEEKKNFLQDFFYPMDHERWHLIKKLRKIKKQGNSPKVFYALGWTSVQHSFSQEKYDDGLKIYLQRSQNYSFSSESLDEMVQAVKNWKKRGFHVFAFRPPTPQKMIEIENRTYDENLVKKAFSDAGGIWLSFPGDTYQTYDASHLTTESSKIFSRDLGITLQRYLGNGK